MNPDPIRDNGRLRRGRPRRDDVLLSILKDRFLAHKRMQQRAPLTLLNYESDLSRFCEWVREHKGRRDLSMFTLDTLEDYQAYLVNQGYAVASVLRAITVLSEFGKFLVAKTYIGKSPVGQLTKPRKSHRLPDVLSAAETTMLLTLPLSAKEAAIRAIFCYAGARRSAITRLDLRDVKLDLGVLIFRGGKGGKDLAVPMAPPLKAAMEGFLLARGPGAPEDPVFRGRWASRLPSSRIYAMVRRWGAKIGRPRLHPHLLRHTMLTRLVELTGDVTKAQEVAGHESIETTMRYVHLVRTRLAADLAGFGYEKIIAHD